MDIEEIIDKINGHGDNKILLAVYEDKINLTLNYSTRADSEQSLKLYTFLKFYLKQLEKELDDTFEKMYFDSEEDGGEGE